MRTATPLGTVAPLMPAMNVVLWVPCLPIRMVLASPATPRWKMSILLLSVVGLIPVLERNARLLLTNATEPVAVLLSPMVLLANAAEPVAVLSFAVVLWLNAWLPVAVLLTPVVLLVSASTPIAVL